MAKRVASRKTSTVKAKRGMGTRTKPVKKTTRKTAAKKPLARKGRPARAINATGL